ncbi:unnamed protein product [Cladocopium goreaui]|uniref:Uncharacterized protein n=1 Tax=Cladocopium goreaui TaxID=2562237 RepID=A0A9P1M0U5_9DINO|nr:unnamed protein product [Cladocopium goreaui]
MMTSLNVAGQRQNLVEPWLSEKTRMLRKRMQRSLFPRSMLCRIRQSCSARANFVRSSKL